MCIKPGTFFGDLINHRERQSVLILTAANYCAVSLGKLLKWLIIPVEQMPAFIPSLSSPACAHAQPWHRVVPPTMDPLGTALPRGQGLSATVTSPPDFPSDKPNKFGFFSLIGQLTSERLGQSATGIFLLSCQEVARVQVKCRAEEGSGVHALRWVPKPT